MKFQIQTKDGVALTMSELDKEASAFFNVEVNDNHYAHPNNKRGFDWFNWIGCAIACLPEGRVEWSEVIGRMSATCSLGESSATSYFDSLLSITELIDLAIHWRDKGYIPVSL